MVWHIIGLVLLSLLGLVLLLLLLLLFTPLRIRVEYVDAWRVTVRLFGVISVYRFSSDKPEKPPMQEKPSAEKEKASSPKKEKKKSSFAEEVKDLYKGEGVSGVLSFFQQLAALCGKAAKRLLRGVTVRQLDLCIRVGSDDASDTALHYGQVCAALFPSLSALEYVLRVKKQRVLVQPEFLAAESSARTRLMIWIWPFHVAWAAICLLCGFLAARAGASSPKQQPYKKSN